MCYASSMPEITQLFPQPTDRCGRVIKHILLAPQDSKGSLIDLESIKELKPFGFTKGDRERRGCLATMPQSFSLPKVRP